MTGRAFAIGAEEVGYCTSWRLEGGPGRDWRGSDYTRGGIDQFNPVELGTTQDEALHGLSRMRPFLQPLLHIRPLFGDVGVVL